MTTHNAASWGLFDFVHGSKWRTDLYASPFCAFLPIDSSPAIARPHRWPQNTTACELFSRCFVRLDQCGLRQTARLLPAHVVEAGAVAGELKLYSFDAPAAAAAEPHASAALSAYGIPLGIPVHAALGDSQCSFFACLQRRSDAGSLLLILHTVFCCFLCLS
jgi:hypothetical protein